MEVTLTMEPLALASSCFRPWASQMVENRLTSNTWRHSSWVESRVPSRSPWGPLGEIAALLTRACSLPSSRRTHLLHRPRGVARVGQVDLDMILRPRRPGAVFRKGVARTGDHPPAGAGKTLHRGMADAARCPSED